MRLDFVMVADSAALDPRTGKLDIIGGAVTHITAPELPFAAPAVSLVLRFVLETDAQPEARLSIRLRDPEAVEIFTINGTIGADLVAVPAHAGEERSIVVVARLEGIVFRKYGRHTFELLLDDTEIEQRPVAVVPEDDLEEESV